MRAVCFRAVASEAFDLDPAPQWGVARACLDRGDRPLRMQGRRPERSPNGRSQAGPALYRRPPHSLGRWPFEAFNHDVGLSLRNALTPFSKATSNGGTSLEGATSPTYLASTWHQLKGGKHRANESVGAFMVHEVRRVR